MENSDKEVTPPTADQHLPGVLDDDQSARLAYLSAIVDSSQDAIIGKTLDGTITCWNAGAERLYGYTAGEAVGRPIAMLLPPGRLDEVPAILARVARGERVEQYETVRRRKDGTLIDVSLTVSAITGRDGRILGASVIACDITDRKLADQSLREHAAALQKANQALEEMCEKAEAATKAKSQFLANMSHEIRTPMTAILGYANVLLDCAREEVTIEAAQIIKRNGEHLLNLLNDVLDLSHIESGKEEIEITACSPRQIAADVVSLMKVRADAKGLKLSLEALGPIPGEIQCDPSRLRQILINLVGNAIKFTDTGSVRVAIETENGPEENARLRFDVIDTGIGISSEQMGLLFQPFSQIDASSRRRFGGSGMGLAISKRLARLLDGEIEVSSIPGQGATFSLTLSVPKAPQTSRKSMTAIDEVQEAAHPATQELDCHVLLVEDGPDNQRLITFLLQRAGARVTVVENGQLALDKVLNCKTDLDPIDLILMDMQMPVMDGYEATYRLRNAGWHGPIIALTAHAMSFDREKCLVSGCDDYLSKPVDQKTLIETIIDRTTKETVAT